MPGSSALSSSMVLNPLLSGSFSAAKTNAFEGMKAGVNGIPWYVICGAILVLIWLVWLFSTLYWSVPSEGVIRNALQKKVQDYGFYANKRSSRKGLKDYLEALKRQGVPDSHLAVTNFFVCSVNTPVIFTPIRDGIASPDAIRLSLAAGARYLDIEMHPSGPEDKYIPNVAVMDEGSLWREITLNKLSFKTVMQNVVKYGIADGKSRTDLAETPYMNDPLFLMLRFKGKPKKENFTATAKILQETIEKMRLDFVYNGGRRAGDIFKMPITMLFNKVIILSNVYPPLGNEFNDYINIGPRSAPKLDLPIGEIIATPDDQKVKLIKLIQQNLTITRTEMEEPDCNENKWDWKKAHEVGVHFAALNFWSLDEKLTEYTKPDLFGVASFNLKPQNLRYVIEYVEPPGQPNPKLNAGDGTPAAPGGITF